MRKEFSPEKWTENNPRFSLREEWIDMDILQASMFQLMMNQSLDY